MASQLNCNFNSLNDAEKVVYILSNDNIIFLSAKTCHNILEKRKSCIYNCQGQDGR